MCTEWELRRVLLDTKSGLDDIFGARLQNVILYGSYARGEQDAESDIDVMALVDLPKEELVRYRRRVSDFPPGLIWNMMCCFPSNSRMRRPFAAIPIRFPSSRML